MSGTDDGQPGSGKGEVANSHNSSTAYIIAGITFGAALGNMFLAGRIKNVMKINIPKSSSYARGATGARSKGNSQAGAYQEQTKTNGSPEEASEQMYRAAAAARRELLIPPHVRDHLSTLQLPHGLVSEKQVKEAYRVQVMKYHPDRIHAQIKANDTGGTIDKKKLNQEEKFKAATQSYEYLMQHFAYKD